MNAGNAHAERTGAVVLAEGQHVEAHCIGQAAEFQDFLHAAGGGVVVAGNVGGGDFAEGANA